VRTLLGQKTGIHKSEEGFLVARLLGMTGFLVAALIEKNYL